MNRIDRISALLIQLQSRPVVKASEMADRFGVSLRTIYRDIRTLSEADVPICGDSGIGYSLVEGYRLPPLIFTKEEAMAFVTAEKFIEQITDEQNTLHFRRGMDKIRAVLRKGDKSDLAQMDKQIEVHYHQRLSEPKIPNLLQTILHSIHEKQAIRMGYFTPSRNDHTERTVEAVGVSYFYPYWYLIAYCHLRNEYRNFRLDRIEKIDPAGFSFTRPHPPLKDLLPDFDSDCRLIKVVLRTTSTTAELMGNGKFNFGIVSEKEVDEGVVEQTYMSWSLDSIARWTLSFADTTRVVEPEELREKIKQIIKNIEV